MAGNVNVSVHSPERVAAKGNNGVNYLKFDDGCAAVFTTAARVRAMEFAFNNPEAVLALIDGQGVSE